MRSLMTIGMLLALVAAPLVASGDTPPNSSKSLSSILEGVLDSGYTDVTEISFDDGRWEIECLKGRKSVGLAVNPQSGKIVTEYADEPHPKLPAKSKSLLNIIHRLEKSGYTPIKKAEFEVNGWEVEAMHDSTWRELTLDTDGEILTDRLDD